MLWTHRVHAHYHAVIDMDTNGGSNLIWRKGGRDLYDAYIEKNNIHVYNNVYMYITSTAVLLQEFVSCI